MKRFFIGENEVNVEISPVLAETLDETLDNMTVTLEINEDSHPLAPMQEFTVKEDDEVILNFIISSDMVQLATENPLRYRHTLNLVQKSEFLTHHEIRNTVFSTSLETSSFSVFAGGTVLVKGVDLGIERQQNEYWANLSPLDTFTYAADKVIASIDLSQKKIKNLHFKNHISLYFSNNASIEVQPGFEFLVKIDNAKQNIPSSWADIYAGIGKEDTAGKYLPNILFKITNNGVVETRVMTLESKKVRNELVFTFSDENKNILTWIKSHNSGILEISVENYQDRPTFINDRVFFDVGPDGRQLNQISANKIPAMITYTLEVMVDSVEYSVYSVIDTLLKQQMKECKLYNSSNDPTIRPLFKLPDDNGGNQELRELLETTSSPNFVFTQANLFNALIEIFNLFDAIFTIDKDGYLDIEYYNEHNKIEMPDNLKAGRNSGLTEERYNNKLISYYQNTKIDDRFPNSNDVTATAYVRSRTLGVPNQQDYVFVVPKPIDVVKKAYMSLPFNGSFEYSFTRQETSEGITITRTIDLYFHISADNFLLDITDNVVESSIWSILGTETDFTDYYKIRKYNSFCYQRGQNFIDTGGYYYNTHQIQQAIAEQVIKSAFYRMLSLGQNGIVTIFPFGTTSVKNLKFAVEYVALTDGKLEIEGLDNKYPGESFANQGEGSIDIYKLGLNMVGLNLKLGQPTLSMTQKFSNWNDRVKKGQFFIDENGDKWVANICNYTLITNDLVQTSIEFVKNFNGLSRRIQLNRERRLSLISNELTVKAEELYGEYIYYCSDEISNPQDRREAVAFKPLYLANQIALTFGGELSVPAAIRTVNIASRTETVTIAQLNSISGEANKLYKIHGYCKTKNSDLTASGFMTIAQNSNLSGATIQIPFNTISQSGITIDEITDRFVYHEINDFMLNRYTRRMDEGYELDIYVNKVNGVIIGGAISYYYAFDLSGFNPIRVSVFYDKNSYTCEYALITALDENNNVIQVQNQNAANISVPLLIYGSGNSVCFEMSFDNPLSAGTQLLEHYTSDIWLGGWFSRYVVYTDERGFAPKFTIEFVKLQEPTTRFFPKMVKDLNDTPISNYQFGKLEEFAYYKKPNEIFALNYQLHFLPMETAQRTFMGQEFIKNNGFKNGLNKNQLYICYSLNENDVYSILDTKAYGEVMIPIKAINNSVYSDSLFVRFDFLIDMENPSEYENIKSWCICDENRNLYFSSNAKPLHDAGTFSLFFVARHHRL